MSASRSKISDKNEVQGIEVMLHQQQTFFLGRQPILDVRQEIVGYELLFRSSEKNFSDF